MLRSIVCGIFVLLVGAGGVFVGEAKGKLKSVDADKSTLTVTANDKVTSYDVSKDAKVIKVMGRGKKATLETVKDGLKGVTSGSEVILTTEKKDDKDVVTQVKIEGGKRKKNK